MSGARLVWNRIAGDRVLMLAACLTVLFAITVLAALAGFTGSVGRDGLRRTLAESSFDATGTKIAASVPGGGFDRADQAVHAAVRDTYRDLPATVSVSARGDSYTLPGEENAPRPRLTAFATYAGIERQARLLSGRWAAPSPGGGPVEATLHEAAAREMGVGPGDTLTLRGGTDRTARAQVKVTGLFRIDRPGDYFWQGDRLVTTGVERLDHTTVGPFVVPPATFAGRFVAGGVYARWTVLPDMSAIGPGELVAIGNRAARTQAALEAQVKGGPSIQFGCDTALPQLARQLGRALQVARSTMLIPVLQLVVLAGYALMLVARLLAEHRRTEAALLRARGASLSQLALLTVAEGLMLVLPAAVLAPLLAAPLLRLAGRAPIVRDTGLSLDAGPLAPLWAVSVAAALVCAVVLAAPTLRNAALTYVEVQTRRGRTARRGLVQRSGADLVLLAVTAIGIWQMVRYNGPLRVSATETDAAAGSSIDPLVVSGPALALLAGGLLVLRAAPVVSRVAERWLARGRGLAPALGAWQVGRRPARSAGPALLLVMAMAVGVLSVATISTWRSSQEAQADFQSAADLRLGAPQNDQTMSPLGQGGRLAELPGVQSATPVLRREVGSGDQRTNLLAGDATALGGGLGLNPAAVAALTGNRPRQVLAQIPGEPETITLRLRLSRRAGGWDVADAGDAFVGTVTLVDRRGVLFRVRLPGLRPDGRPHTITLQATELAGAAGKISYPLSVRGLHYSYGTNPANGNMDLAIESVHGDGPVRAPGKDAWDLFVSAGSALTGRPKLTVSPSSLVNLYVPTSYTYEGNVFYDNAGDEINAVLVDPAARVDHSVGSPTAGEPGDPLSAVITADMAKRFRVAVGGNITVQTGDGKLPLKVAGIVKALPSTPADRLAAFIDLPTFAEFKLAAGAEPMRPNEWWLKTRGGQTAAAASTLAAHPELAAGIVDRNALRRQLRDAPLAGALQGALILGFLAALAFALVGFVVNAAVSARERAAEFAVLRALGVRRRLLMAALAVEQTFLVVLGLTGGLALGLLLAQLVIPNIVVSVRATVPYPPVELLVDWPAVLTMLAGTVAVLALVLLLLGHGLNRRGLGAELRMGEGR